MDPPTLTKAIRSSWRIILVVTIAAGLLALGISQALPKEYTAESRVLVGSITDPSTDKLTAYQQLAQAYADLVTTTPALERVGLRLGGTLAPRDIAPRVDARVGIGEMIVTITARAASPIEASQLANAMADEITTMSAVNGTAPNLARTVQPAMPPDGPSFPRPFLNVLVAVSVAFLLSVGVALYLASHAAQADRPARDREELLKLFEERLARRAR